VACYPLPGSIHGLLYFPITTNESDPMADQYTPFRESFPAFVLADAFAVIRAGQISKAGAAVLAHCAIELQLWGMGTYFTSQRGTVASSFGPSEFTALTDAAAHAVLDQSQQATEPGTVAVSCPLTPGSAIGLALWLLKLIAPILL
jgi:hypothetical protein